MITSPYVTTATKAILSDQSNLAIDNKEINLEVVPQFQDNPTRWQAMLDPLHNLLPTD